MRRFGVASLRGAVLCFVVFSMLQASSASVVLLASDNGTDLTLRWTGDLNLGTNAISGFTANINQNQINQVATAVYGVNGEFHFANLGTTQNDPVFSPVGIANASSTAFSFGYSTTNLYWDDSLTANLTPDGSGNVVITPTGSFVIQNQTVASMFGTNLDSGNVEIWRVNSTGDTISFGLDDISGVPEPSAAILFGIAISPTLVRRRRMSTN